MDQRHFLFYKFETEAGTGYTYGMVEADWVRDLDTSNADT
jgi:hypothetical protein